MNSHTISPCHPIQCILPPHMVEAIKIRGDDYQRQMALDIETEAASFRADRVAAAPPTSFHAAPLVAAAAQTVASIKVYDCSGTASLPGQLVNNTPNSGDTEADQAHDGAQETYNLYLNEFQRDSLDGNGLPLDSSVHYRQNYNNAFWNGSQMAYGDGDGIVFKALTGDIAVIGHELSHGVVQYSGGLVYRDQSGALNEHIADVFGSLTKQERTGENAANADWLVGEGILGNGINGVALRSMKAPGTAYDDNLLGKDPQPYHMDDYVNTFSDNGGVHINSGIPNHAFYLLAIMLGGSAKDQAGHIWYDALQSINNPHARFSEWAEETVIQARQRFGVGSIEAILTRRAWKLVGINI
jgi:Zn-dependent metalloprotease